jgi:2,4-dienoyl-CoA reductase-like NADH-dependent reductase (Old Yellow Enzyme family)
MNLVENDKNIVFGKAKIGNLEIPNHLVRSATYESRATEDGFVTPELVDYYSELARGGIGLSITGVTNVREDGRQLAKMVGNYSDDYIDGLSQIAGNYHDEAKKTGNLSKLILQIGHSGSQITHWGWGGEVVSSCDLEYELTHKIPRKLEREEIFKMAELFGEAANRGKKAGFDGIELHGAHGYLITQFYSPYLNRRTDEYGGSIYNRVKFPLEILKSIRKKVGSNYPIGIKMNGSDRMEGGLDSEEACVLANLLAKGGFDFLEISSYIHKAGMLENVISIPPESQKNVRERGIEAYNLKFAIKIKDSLSQNFSTDIPIILVGGLYRFKKIVEIIANHKIDFCSMSRPLIRQPDLPNIWKSGPPFPDAECIHCNLCTNEFITRGPKSKGVRCIQKERQEKKIKAGKGRKS